MATSGTTTFNLQKSDILNLAMQRINNLGLGQVLASDDSTLLSNTLNLMIKSWQPSLFPWTLTRGYLFLDRGQTEYHIDGTLAHATKTAHITTLSAAAGAGASAINVTSGTGFAIGYYVGVVQDTGYVAWTTASGVSGTSIALTAPTSTAAASGNRVYVYQTKISNILDITGVERVDTNSFSMPLEEMGRDAYFGASNNAQEVTAINNYYVDKQLGDVVLNVSPAPASGSHYLTMSYRRRLEDMTADANTLDFPAEWTDCIVDNLAYRAAAAFDLLDKRSVQLLGQEAKASLARLSASAKDVVNYKIIPKASRC